MIRILLVSVRNILHSLMSRFFWEGSSDKRKMHLVGWESITVPCNKGGLGISDLADMNAALLIKWIYRERDRLWRRVVCAKSGAGPSCLSLTCNRRSSKSTLVNIIGLLLDRNEKAAALVLGGFKYLIGNGSNSDFWCDNWTDRGELKVMFPMIFALSNTKEGPISSFGEWIEGTWHWNIQL